MAETSESIQLFESARDHSKASEAAVVGVWWDSAAPRRGELRPWPGYCTQLRR